MSVIRTQFMERQDISLPSNGTLTVDVNGPVTTPPEPPYAEGTDHVIKKRQLRENESGIVYIDFSGAAVVATTLVTAVEIWNRGDPDQTGLTPSLFPTGAALANAPYKVRDVFTGSAPITDAALRALFGGTLDDDTTKHTPALSLQANQYVRITLSETAGGGDLAGVVTAKYDLGLNPAVGGSQP